MTELIENILWGIIMKMMKWLLSFSFIVSVGAQAAPQCSVGQTYTTSVGATFECVKHRKFGEAWRDPDGIVWSRNLGAFTNTGPIQNGIINSDATRVCSIIGSHLPTKAEYEKFQSFFEYERNVITRVGKGDLLNLFPDYLDNNFWSSSVLAGNDNFAWGINGINGGMGTGHRNYYFLVRCISR
jgi:hypothetical protein